MMKLTHFVGKLILMVFGFMYFMFLGTAIFVFGLYRASRKGPKQ